MRLLMRATFASKNINRKVKTQINKLLILQNCYCFGSCLAVGGYAAKEAK